MEKPKPCCLIAQVTSSLTWYNSSLQQSHSRACLLVFLKWSDQMRQQSKLCGPLLCSSDVLLLWAGHKGIIGPLSSFLVGNNLLNLLVKYPTGVPSRQSGAFCLRLGASQFLFLCEPQHYIFAFWNHT